VCGLDVVGLDSLLTEPFVKRFTFFLHNERKCERTTVVGRLSKMFSALESSPDFERRDFSWRYSVYRKLRKEPESALKDTISRSRSLRRFPDKCAASALPFGTYLLRLWDGESWTSCFSPA
jgi:hypothetical protein